jgi:RNA polymerase sigma-32 factor
MVFATRNISPGSDLSGYLQEIRKLPMLSREEELALARNWREHNDTEAAHKLVTSHLRLVVKIAAGYRGYGLPLAELIGEGNIGMIQAAQRFDPERGFRLATYAIWWIRAAIQKYVLDSWSLVKMGSTRPQKALFFSLRRLKAQMQAIDQGDLHPEQVAEIARVLGVSAEDVISMNLRLAAHDHSLNSPVGRDMDDGSEVQDRLLDTRASPEDELGEREELLGRQALLPEALTTLGPRERHILTERRLRDKPATLGELAQQYGISRERVRQVEVRAFGKLRKTMRARALENQFGINGASAGDHAHQLAGDVWSKRL